MTLRQKENSLTKTYKELSIQVSLNGLSFSIYNTLHHTTESVEHISFLSKNIQTPENLLTHVREEITSNPIFQEQFDALTVIHTNTLATPVPNALLDEEHLADYLKFSVKILATDFITYDTLENADIAMVYVPFVNINNFFIDYFGEFNYIHHSTALLNKLFKLPYVYNEPVCYIHFNTNTFDLVVLKNKNLILYNHFEFKTAEDFIYYVLFTFEQLKLDTNTVKTVCIGNITEESDVYSLAYTYINKISILKQENTTASIPKESFESTFLITH